MKYRHLLVSSLGIIAFSLLSCDSYKNPSSVKFEFTSVSAKVEIHTDFQKQFLDSADKDQFVADNNTELSYFSKSEPNKIKISYTLTSDNGSSPKEVYAKVSEKEDMSNSMSFTGKDGEVEIYNFKIGTTYYYQMVGHYVSDFTSEVKSFTVNNNGPRNLSIEGMENVRDLGGWNIGQGKTYKQGMIYRTAQFNYGSGNTFKSAPTELGLKILKEDLKIKTDIDLRKTKAANDDDEVVGITSSPLGDDVKYLSLPMVYGGKNVFEQADNAASLKAFFEALSDINNYPMAFHCIRGTDRTGALAYALGALLGMSKEDLMTDYLFSNFARISSTIRANSISNFYVKGIDESEGETLSIKARNYIKAKCDVSDVTLDSIVSILTA